MRRMRILMPIACSVLLHFAVSASAADNCNEAQTQTDMNLCTGEALESADAALNEAYREITERLSDEPAVAARLRDAQRAWITFRDAECSFINGPSEGGSIYPALENSCLADLTGQRAETLRGYLQCEEGDLSCPVPDAQ